MDDSVVLDREKIIQELAKRDGYRCMFPGCDLPFKDGRWSVSIDHIYPQALCKQEGWTFEQTWDLTNLQLMHVVCNARKGNSVYDESGNLLLSERPVRATKADRPMTCNLCMSGRLLWAGEVCELCGSGPQPATAPKYLQVAIKDCDHDTTHCGYCYTGIIPRKSALEGLITG